MHNVHVCLQSIPCVQISGALLFALCTRWPTDTQFQCGGMSASTAFPERVSMYFGNVFTKDTNKFYWTIINDDDNYSSNDAPPLLSCIVACVPV